MSFPRMVKIFIGLFILLLVQACHTTEPMIRYKNVLVTPPDALLRDCPVEAPPDRVVYKAAEPTEQERLLMDHSTAQLKNISLCNTDKSGLRDWKKNQEALFKEKEGK